MKRLTHVALATLALLICPASHADTPQVLLDVIAQVSPEAPPTAVQPAAVAGLYEVIFGSTVYYFSADGRYMLGGPLIEVASRRNLTEAAAQAVERDTLVPQRLAFLKQLKDKDAIVFSPVKPAHRVTVFTDTDCGWCRELHRHIDQYQAAGIAVRYVAFPRAGEDSESFRKAQNVWCAADRKAAITEAKAGKAVPEKVCENPVLEQYQAGQKLGVSGTPAILLDDGRLLGGYVAPNELKRLLDAPGD